MAVSQAKKKTVARKRPAKKSSTRKGPAKKRKSARRKSGGLSFKRLFAAVVLMGMLVFSIGVVGYVIFFRTVLA